MLETERIVIIGGGIIGCSTAYYLTKAGYSNVCVVEAVSVAHAASGRAGGFLAKDWCDQGPTKHLARRSFQLHQQLASDLDTDIGYRRLKTLSVTVADKENRAEKDRSDGMVPSWVDGNLSRSEVIGQHDSTAQVHPALLTSALMCAAQQKGAKLIEQKVVGANYSGENISSINLVNGETLTGDVFVLCMGPWTSIGLGWFNKAAVISGKRAHSVSLIVEPGCVDDTALFLQYKDDYEGKSIEPEVYPRPDGSVYVCGSGRDDTPLPPDPAHVAVDPEACKKLVNLAGKVSGKLVGKLGVTNSACYLPCSRDSTPVIGAVPGYKQLYIASGHYCWGILQGPATGEALAEMITTGQTPEILNPFKPSRLIK